ncbi:hypothetical protein D3C80_1456200 [compost metagenome]
MPVNQARIAGGEQLVEANRQVGRHRFGSDKALAQGTVDAPFETPIASQVQTLPGQYQWPLPSRSTVISSQSQQRAVGQGLAPGLHIQMLEQLRRQQQGPAQGIAFRRQRQGEIRCGKGLAQVQAHMPMAQLMTGQGSSQQHQRMALGVALTEEGHERPVQRPQPAALDPAIEQLEQVFTA